MGSKIDHLASIANGLDVALSNLPFAMAERGHLTERLEELEAKLAEWQRLDEKAEPILSRKISEMGDRIDAFGRENASLKTQVDAAEEELHAAKAYSEVLVEHDKKIAAENARLEDENQKIRGENRALNDRLTDQTALANLRGENCWSLREENASMGRLLRDAEEKGVTAEARAIRAEVDLASAIRTGEEQAGEIVALNRQLNGLLNDYNGLASETARIRTRLDDRLDAEGGRFAKLETLLAREEVLPMEPTAEWQAMDAQDQWFAYREAAGWMGVTRSWEEEVEKSRRVMALLASEEVPETIVQSIYNDLSGLDSRIDKDARLAGAGVWRWFREQLGADGK